MSENLALADKNDEYEQPDENVVRVSEIPDLVGFGEEMTDHLQNPVHSHHSVEFQVQEQPEIGKELYLNIN